MSQATCHPDRPRYVKSGLCQACYWKTPEGRAKFNAYQREYRRRRYQNDPEFRRRHLESVRRSKAKKKRGG